MKLTLLVLLTLGLAFVLSNPVDKQIHKKHEAVDIQRKAKELNDNKNAQLNQLDERDKQIVQPQETGHIQRQVKMLISDHIGNQIVMDKTGNIDSKSPNLPAHQHMMNGKLVKCCHTTELVGYSVPVDAVTISSGGVERKKNLSDLVEYKQSETENRLADEKVADGELIDSITLAKNLGNVGAATPIQSIKSEHGVSPEKEIQRLKRRISSNTLKVDQRAESKDEDVTETAADIKKRQVVKTAKADDVIAVDVASSLEIMIERIKRLDTSSIKNLDQLKQYLNKEDVPDVLEKPDLIKERQADEIGNDTLILTERETSTGKSDNVIVNDTVMSKQIADEIVQELAPLIDVLKGMKHLKDSGLINKLVASPNSSKEIGTTQLLEDKVEQIVNAASSSKLREKNIENAEVAKIQSTSPDNQQRAEVKAVSNEKVVEAPVRVLPDVTDIGVKVTERLPSERKAKAARKQRAAAIFETVDDVIPKSLPVLSPDVMHEVDKIEVHPETNTGLALNGDLQHPNRAIAIKEVDMEILVERASVTQNGNKQQVIRSRSKRQSDDDFAADYYPNLNKLKPFVISPAEDREASHITEPFHKSNALKLINSGSKAVPEMKPALDNTFTNKNDHPQFCNGVHQIIIHDPVHCPILTCVDFDSLKYEWLVCIYGQTSRVVVLGDGDIPIGDNILGNYPSLRCVCDIGFVMNNIGECIRRSKC